jgi:nicotinamide phosphoribosyltransferase
MKDGYKVSHIFQYPSGTRFVYSNLTPRKSRRESAFDLGGVIFFGLQFFIVEYLQRRFNEDFFLRPRSEVVAEYKRRIDGYLGPDAINYDHIGALHDLGYLPLKIKAVPEGTFVPYGVPALTIINTKPEFFWLTNMLETLMSSVLWKASTSATTALLYRKVFNEYAIKTGSPLEFVPWQGHDFSFRGMCGVEDAAISGAGHLLSFTGTDTIPAIDFLEEFYGANCETELIGGSVAATEHSVMCMGLPDCEEATFKRLLTEVNPGGILSIVSDTWDLWRVLTEYVPALKDIIIARDGKLVIRPDSGDPIKITCGDPDAPVGSPQNDGVIQLLWDCFGGTITSTGYKLLDPHIGMIYGDGINPERQLAILSGLERNGFASGNVVLGLGSYTYQYVTRDTDGWAMKATWGETESRGPIDIFKDPVTDDGTKKSAAGLLAVIKGADGVLRLKQHCTSVEEQTGELQTVYRDGLTFALQSLSEIRTRVETQL